MGISLKKKHLQLIRTLSDCSDYVTANSLALKIDVSIRSVKNYVKEVNAYYPDAIISSRDGYTINPIKAKEILDNLDPHIPQSSEERIVYIINRLIKDNVEIDSYDICDELCISYSTLKNELYKMKKKLRQFDLSLTINDDQLSIEGLEKNKRKMLSSILYDESKVNFVNLKLIQDSFVDINTEFIKNCILEIFTEHHYFVNDYSLINLVVHIAIAIDRIRHQNVQFQNFSELPALRSHEYQLAKQVSSKIEEHFHIIYSDSEVYELALLLISRATTLDYKSINPSNLQDFIGKESFELVIEMIQSVNSYYYLDLSEPEFFIRFALHIRNLLLRSKNNYYSKNPLTEEIKTSCPLIYDVSVYLSSLIKEKIGISIVDDEIAYIAFHLGSTLEAQESLKAKITAVLYCPNYYDINTRLTDTINHHFSYDLLITNIITSESDFENLPKCDLILSTIPTSYVLTTPSMLISIFFTEKDIYRLRKKLEEVRVEKKKRVFQGYLETLLIPSLFEKRNDLKTGEEAIHYMAEKMMKEGFVDESFEANILAREQMSSTAFYNFALPHAMKMNAKKTGINVLISENPILWNDRQVHMVMMLSFNRNERYIFNEIYDPITMILTNKENMQKIIQAKDYKDFIHLLASSLDTTQ